MITVKGSISRTFAEYELTYDYMVSLIGKPIRDINRNQIGVIDNIDILTDIWVGHLYDDCVNGIPEFLSSRFNVSFEIVKGD